MNTMVNADAFIHAVELSRPSQRSAMKMIDALDSARHLIRVAVMACDSIEDIDSRNGLVALFSEIEAKVDNTAHSIRQEFVDVVALGRVPQ